MANFVFNVAKGSVGEYYNRVDNNDPATCALIVMVLATSGLESDATLIDVDTVSALVAGTTNEVGNSGYARKVLVGADLGPRTPDDTGDKMDLDIPDQTWTAVAAGDGWSKVVIAFRPATGSADTAVIPLTAHDFVIVPDGSDITAQIAAAGFFRAS